MTLETAAPTAGGYLRMWRERRGLSQLDLTLEADISQRHLSFLESGRSMPSRRMVLHLAERLDIPLRDRNDLLVAAGFAPVYTGLALDDPARTAEHGGVLVPLKLATDAGLLSFLSTTTVFGMPRDILLSEIAIEAFFPADAETGMLLRRCDEP